MTATNQSLGARILNALYERLRPSEAEAACGIVRALIREMGEDVAALGDAVLDKLHMQLPYPTEACTIVRSVILNDETNRHAA